MDEVDCMECEKTFVPSRENQEICDECEWFWDSLPDVLCEITG